MMRNDEPTSRTLLHICSTINGKDNFCWDTREQIPFNEWFNLTIKQEKNDEDKYMYSISMNGVELRSWENTTPMTFENVDGIIANAYQPERDYKVPAGPSRYRNFKFTTSP